MDLKDKEIERLKKIIEFQRKAIDRYLPCPDHRDKFPTDECIVCYLERKHQKEKQNA